MLDAAWNPSRATLGALLLVVGATGGCKDGVHCVDRAICTAAAEQYVPAGAPVRSMSSRRFTVDGASYDFVAVEYGAPNDCPSGCFYSTFCTIVPVEPAGEDLPLGYAYFHPTEAIPALTSYCAAADYESEPSRCAMPAYGSPLLVDPAVVTWADDSGSPSYCSSSVRLWRYSTGH